MRVALYLRRSTNDRLQADSLTVQEQICRAYAKDHGMTIVETYADSASGTSTKHRAAFLQMVEVITHGAPFAAVLVRDVSRFGRFFDVDEGAFFEVLFLSHHVQTVYCEEVFASDTSPMASLIKGVRRVMASEYSRDRSRLVRSAQARATRLGFHAVGAGPYGLRRIMVTQKGVHVRDLGPGEWKALGNHRTKLVPGDPEAASVIRRIFALYAEGGLLMSEIVKRLNAEQVPSPRGGRWNQPTVATILTNARYAGVAFYHPRPSGISDPLDAPGRAALRVDTPGASDALIEPDLWERTQRRFFGRTVRRSSDALASDLRLAYGKHGCVEWRMFADLPTHCTWDTYQNRFARGVDEALECAFAEVIDRAAHALDALLKDAFRVERTGPIAWTLDGALRVAFRASFKHRNRWDVFWRISGRGLAADAVVSVGIHPDGTATPFLLARNHQLASRSRGLLLSVENPNRYERHQFSEAALVERLKTLSRSTSPSVEEMFTEAARAMPVLNFNALARTLDWPAHAVWRTYARLRARGVWLPPPGQLAGRFVTITCAGCGASRVERPRVALKLCTDLCVACTRKRPRQKIAIRCPDCGREAERWPSGVRQLSQGAATPCRGCTIRRRVAGRPRSGGADPDCSDPCTNVRAVDSGTRCDPAEDPRIRVP